MNPVAQTSSDANEGEYETIDNFQDTTFKPHEYENVKIPLTSPKPPPPVSEYEDVNFPPTTSPKPPPTVSEYEYVIAGTVVNKSNKDFDITDCAAYGVTRTH